MNHFDQILKASIFTPTMRGWGLPIMLEGRMGIGKSSRVRALAAAYGLDCKTVSPALSGEAAFGAVPVPTTTEGGMYLDCPAPYWLHGFEDGVLLIDEVGSAPEHLLPPLLSVLVEGVVGGGHVIPGRVRILGATNPERMSVNGSRLAPNVTCRFGWVDANIDDSSAAAASLGDWLTTSASGATAKVSSAIAEEARVLDAWPLAFAKAAGGAKGFFKARPDLVEAYKEGARVWPNPRAWETAVRAHASSMVHGLDGAAEAAFIGAFIGEGAAQEYLTFASQSDIPDPDTILFGDAQIAWDRKRQDKAYAAVGACVSRLASMAGDPSRAESGGERLLTLLAGAPSVFADLVVTSAVQVQGLDIRIDPKLIIAVGGVSKNALRGK